MLWGLRRWQNINRLKSVYTVLVEGSEHSRGLLSPRMSAIVQYISLNEYILLRAQNTAEDP